MHDVVVHPQVDVFLGERYSANRSRPIQFAMDVVESLDPHASLCASEYPSATPDVFMKQHAYNGIRESKWP